MHSKHYITARPQVLTLRDDKLRVCFVGEFPSIASAKRFAYDRGYQLGNDDWELRDVGYRSPYNKSKMKYLPHDQYILEQIYKYYSVNYPWYLHPQNYEKHPI